MKVGVLFEGTEKNPEAFNQSLNSALILNEIKNYYSDFNFIILNKKTSKILKNKYDIVMFLSPHQLSLYCSDINFIINIWDIDHKKNSPYSAHNKSYIYEKREKFLNLYRNKIYH